MQPLAPQLLPLFGASTLFAERKALGPPKEPSVSVLNQLPPRKTLLLPVAGPVGSVAASAV